MPICTKLRRKHSKVCIGDLDNEIDINSRTLDDGFDSGEDEIFVPLLSNVFAKVDTLRGVFVIDEVNGGDVEATHRFTIPFPDVEISGELWVNLKGKHYRILSQVNLEERDEYIELMCTVRGNETKGATHA